MKTKEEIEQLAFLKYPRLINDNPLCRNPNNPMEDDNTYERKIWIGAYTQCQEDMAKDVEYWQGEFDHWHQQAMEMADKKLDVDDINEMALDCIISTGGLPDSVEALQYCLHKFYQSLNKQD